MKRLLIYCFYDEKGIVDDFVEYFLISMQKYCNSICIVVNGILTLESRVKLKNLSNYVFERENRGYDSSAFKYAIIQYGYSEILKFDELLLVNSTFYGPIYDLNNVFTKMSKMDVDFWGITESPSLNKYISNVKVGKHLQSYFLGFKKSIITSEDFKQFWDSLQLATNYEEAIAFFELRITEYFKNCGYKYSSYISLDKYFEEEDSYLYFLFKLIKEKQLPFVKRKAFCTKNGILQNCINGGAANLLIFIKEHTDYNVELICNDIKRHYSFSNNILYYILLFVLTLIKLVIIPNKSRHYQNKLENLINTFKILKILK